jgi:alpha-galactosidase
MKVILFLVGTSSALLASSPPMGWRSWNCFKLDVDQDKLIDQARALSGTMG